MTDDIHRLRQLQSDHAQTLAEQAESLINYAFNLRRQADALAKAEIESGIQYDVVINLNEIIKRLHGEISVLERLLKNSNERKTQPPETKDVTGI